MAQKQITKLKSYGKVITNHYSSLNFDTQFAARVSVLEELFNYKIGNRKLQGIKVTGEGKWIKVWVSRKNYKHLNSSSRKQLQRILDKHLYPAKSYRWGYYKQYIALGPHTIGAKARWGGNTSHKIFKVH